MSDPLKGLKPTTGYAELGNENDAGGEVEVGGICVSTDRRARFAGEYVISRDEMNANLLLIADAFNTYTATGLAPSQLQQSFADEKNAHGLAKDKALGWKVEAEILRKDLADEKALTAELVKVLESVLNDAEHNEMTGGYDVQSQNRALAEAALVQSQNRALAEAALARAKGGTR